MRQYIIIASFALLATTLVGCVEGEGPFFDKTRGLADSYFVGQFNYDGAVNHDLRRLQLKLKDKAYAVEENEELIGVATIHNFRNDLLVAQLRRAEGKGTLKAYLYLLVRKTPSGFEIGGLCSKVEDSCEAKSRSDVMSKLDRQAKKLAEDPHIWVSVRRGWGRPEAAAIAQSQNPAEDCNSDERARKASGCTALIEKGGLGGADLALAYSRRSDAYIGSREFDRVISDRKRAIELQPNDATYKLRLSGAYQLRATVTANRRGDDAIADLAEAIRIDPSNYEARVQRATLFVTQHKLPQAIEDAEEAFKTSGTNTAISQWLSTLLAQRAAELMASADFAGAVAVLTRAIQLDPRNPELLLQRGNVLAAKGDYGRAIADYSDALKLRPNYLEALLYRADVHSRAGQADRSLSDADEAVKLDDKSVNALLTRALALETNKEFEAARQDYARALAVDPKQAFAKEGIERIRQEKEGSSRLEQLSREQSALTYISPMTNVALAPAFNCTKAAGLDETTICNDRALAFLDRELSATFRRVQTKPMASGDRQLLRQQQAEWLTKRRQCQSDAGCIAELYRSRTLELQNWTPFME